MIVTSKPLNRRNRGLDIVKSCTFKSLCTYLTNDLFNRVKDEMERRKTTKVIRGIDLGL